MILLSEHQSRREVGACHICAKCPVSQWTPDILGCSMHASAPGKGPAQKSGTICTMAPGISWAGCRHQQQRIFFVSISMQTMRGPRQIQMMQMMQMIQMPLDLWSRSNFCSPCAHRQACIVQLLQRSPPFQEAKLPGIRGGCLDRRRIFNHIDECPWFAGLEVVDRKKHVLYWLYCKSLSKQSSLHWLFFVYLDMFSCHMPDPQSWPGTPTCTKSCLFWHIPPEGKAKITIPRGLNPINPSRSHSIARFCECIANVRDHLPKISKNSWQTFCTCL